MTQSPEAVRISKSDRTGGGDAAKPAHDNRNDVAKIDWPQLVIRIRANDQDAMTELYLVFARGVRYHLCRQLGPIELDDRVHDTFLIVIQAIRRGDLRQPERLMGFVRTIVRRQIAAYIEQAVHRRREQVDLDTGLLMVDHSVSPEQTAMERQRRELVVSILRRMSDRDSEILTRFYLDEQTQEGICREMSLSATQFRLLKSRAKERFGELGRKKVQRPSTDDFVRTSSAGSH